MAEKHAVFRAFRIHEADGITHAGIETLTLADLSPGEVVIRVEWSSVNYKDALAGTGRGRILRRSPLVGGIDAAGHVESSDDPRYRAGDAVLVTGYGMSQDHDGGYAEFLRVPGDWVIPLPDGLSLLDAMTLGTAGFTAALALHRMECLGQTPAAGPLLVTGASGGVGSLAVALLAQCGYEVVAMSGKAHETAFLERLGAARVMPRETPDPAAPPLLKALYGGAIDTVGGETLGWITRVVRPWGNIASIGLAGGSELHTTVMPFILRGVSLIGVNSSGCERMLRLELWRRLATDWRIDGLDALRTAIITLDELPDTFARMLRSELRGRRVVRTS